MHAQYSRNVRALLCAFAAVLTGSLSAQVANKGTAPEDTKAIELPKFEVKDTIEKDSYHATETASAGRIVGKIMDTPTTIHVLTAQGLKDINPTVTFDAVNYLPGVSNNRGSGTGGALSERMTFRGIESFGRTVDSFSGVIQPYGFSNLNMFPTAFVETVELVMGPNSILAPTGAPGGTINIITKSPKFKRANELSYSAGEYFANRMSIDSTGPIGEEKRMAYRAVASYQDSKTFLPGGYRVLAALAAFTYEISPTTRLKIKLYGDKQRGHGTVALAGTNGVMISTPDTVGGAYVSNNTPPGFQYQGWNGDAKWSHRDTWDGTLNTELSAQVTSRITTRLAAQLTYTGLTDVRGFPSLAVATVVNQDTGQVTSVTPVDITNLREVAQYGHFVSRTVQFQNDYAGSFKVGSVQLQPVAGLSYLQGRIDLPLAQTFNVPPANLTLGDYNSPRPANSAFSTYNAHNKGNAWIFQAWTYVRASFLEDRIFLTGGSSRVSAGYHLYNLPYVNYDGVVAGNPNGAYTLRTFDNTLTPTQPKVKPWKDTYMAALMGKVNPELSVYYSFTTNAGLAQQNPLWLAGKQHEFGLKWSPWRDRLTVTANRFAITQSNVGFINPLFTIGQSPIQQIYTDLTSKGFELHATGELSDKVSVIASYTSQKTRDFVGRRLRNIPDVIASGLIKYRLDKIGELKLKNTGVFVGVIHNGDVAGEVASGFTSKGIPIQPGYYIRPWTVYNAGASTTIGRYDFNLNVNNLLNSKFWWQAQARTSLSPYPSTSVILSGRIHF